MIVSDPVAVATVLLLDRSGGSGTWPFSPCCRGLKVSPRRGAVWTSQRESSHERPKRIRYRERRDQGPGRVDHRRQADDRGAGLLRPYAGPPGRRGGPGRDDQGRGLDEDDELREKTGVGDAPKKHKARNA